MLEQNTDRTYWMIGAVLVVGGLIGFLSVAFPEIFELVTTRFQGMVPSL
ncbi:hypothetical protein ABES38_08930 [Bacillus gobiensis]